MNREFLTGIGLGKEDVDKVMAEHGKATTAIKDKVTAQFKSQLTEAQTEVTNLNGVIATRDKDIEDLKKSNKTVDDLNTQLSELQTKYAIEQTERETAKAEAEKELIQTKKSAAVELKAVERKAKNTKLAIASLDGLDGLDYEDKEFDTKLDALYDKAVAANPYVFEIAEVKPETPPATPQITVGGNPQGTPPGEKSWREKMNENVAKARKME